MGTSNKNEIASTGAPLTVYHQQVRIAARSRWVTPKSELSKRIAVCTITMIAVLHISRHNIQILTEGYTTCLFLLLKMASLALGGTILDTHNDLQRFYKPPFKGQDCFLASVLAVCAFVIYHQGRIGLAFFNYQAEVWCWVGYWFEWWTGIVAALSYVSGCTSRKDKPFTFGKPADAAAAAGVDDPPPAYPTESVGGWSLCAARFLVNVGDMIRDD